ncbi:MAG: sugar ABC transporter ATP-binding protein [Spirochaetaceae bacterium]|nr:sugar ABC transporter ATP-binding protein [Spirochaetaceae bacterium]
MFLELKNIKKNFDAVQALDGVDLKVGQGEIHGLLGENGAGKTTLMNILAGSFPPKSGDIIIDGKIIEKMTPKKAMDMKIRFIHQELNLCNDLKVYQNMFLGEELYTKVHFIDDKKEITRAQKVLDSMNSHIVATDKVESLVTAEKQLVEIAKSLLFNSELIIMDEPTSALNNCEIEELFEIMRDLQKSGVSFIYISHKMPEIFGICNKYTVLRDGKFIESGNIKDIDEHIATKLLIGHSLSALDEKFVKESHQSDEVFLSVKGITGDGFNDVTFDLHKGEVLIVTGLQGSGCSELSMSLFGAGNITEGSISVKGKDIKNNSIKVAMESGIGLIPKNRKERGILPDLSIKDNMSLAYYTVKHHKLFVDEKEEDERFFRQQIKMNIKVASQENVITSLSGGNQQKVIFGKWFELDSDVMIMDNPTQGIDVGAKFSIYEIIGNLAKSGKALLVFTNEYPEIHRIADNIIVLYKGRIKGRLNRSEMSEISIMEYSTGTRGEK